LFLLIDCSAMSDARSESIMEDDAEDDDDAEYYRQEVGLEPDPGRYLCAEMHAS